MPIITHTMCTLGLLHKVTIRMPQQLEVTVDAYNLRTTFTVVYIIQSCIHFTNHGPSLPEIQMQPTTHAYGCTYIRTYIRSLVNYFIYVPRSPQPWESCPRFAFKLHKTTAFSRIIHHSTEMHQHTEENNDESLPPPHTVHIVLQRLRSL